jgi:RNA polymerase sigma factor (sigma-70 family)
MSRGQIGGVLHYLRGLFGGAPAARTDRDLLSAFIRGDEAAFAALVERHGPLVWGVCRRLLRQEQDAEDAFQATFLVLARKAGSVGWREDVGNWLYAVALRVARRARARAERQRRRESEALMSSETPAADGPDGELAGIVDEEVGRLPDKYRRPVVLCFLQGKTYGEAARLLGWPEGTVAGRLARAKEMLRRRLTRRGLALPAGAALVVTGAAVPTALAQSTLRAAIAFAAGARLASVPAALAEEVLRTMFFSKWKVAAALLLALAAVGTGWGVLARDGSEPPKSPPEQPPAERSKEEAARTALPKEWAGRWVTEPFAGAESIEVEHYSMGGRPRVYHVTDAKKVAAVVKAVKITGIDNGMFPGCKTPANLIVRRRDGSTFYAGIMGRDGLTTDTGTVTLDEGFVSALGRAVSDDPKAPVDLTELRPAGNDTVNSPPKQARPESLESGFASLDVTYLLNNKLHSTRVNDKATLDALHKTLAVRKTERLTNERAESRNMQVVCKDGTSFYFQVHDRETIFDFNVAKFTLAPAFFDALNKEVSKRAGCTIDVTADKNDLPEKLVRKADEFRKMLDELVAVSRTVKREGKEETVAVETAGELAELMKHLRWVEAPPHELKLPKWDRSAELTLRDGRKVTLTFLHPGKNSEDAATASTMPVLSDIVEVSGLGQMWIDNQWEGRFDNVRFDREQRAKELRDAETTHRICRDLPTFFKFVISVTARYREGKDGEIRGPVAPDEGRAVLALLAGARFEKLDWTEERWEQEVTDLVEGGAGGLDLTPGLGFSLQLVVSGEKEILIPTCGRLTFADSPIAKLQKAIGPDQPDKVLLLPRPKAGE